MSVLRGSVGRRTLSSESTVTSGRSAGATICLVGGGEERRSVVELVRRECALQGSLEAGRV